MTAYQLKPLPGDNRNQSQADIQNNFIYLQNILVKEHQLTTPNGDDTVQGEGRHDFISLFDQGGNLPNPGDGVTTALYQQSKKMFAWVNSGAANIQLTDLETRYVAGAAGQTVLPGNAGPTYMQWGSSGVVASGATVSFNQNFNVIYSVFLTPVNANPRYVTLTAIAVSDFTVRIRDQNGNTSSTDMYWLAIGA